MKTAIVLYLLAATVAFPGLLSAQSADTPIFGQNAPSIEQENKDIIEKALRVVEEAKPMTKDQIDLQLIDPVPAPVKLLPPRTAPMSSEDIAKHARAINLRVGYLYKCLKCDHWHVNLAGGYAIAEDVIVTCDHVLATKTKMREGYLIAVDQDGKVACATAVLAHNAVLDAAVIRVAGAKFIPVPLNSDVRQGASSYSFSRPLQQGGYFTSGIVNRFFWDSSYTGSEPDSLNDLLHLRVNFSNDWAPGSSGSPLFDQAGNAIAHVSMIAGLGSGKNTPAVIMMHIGIPAKPIERLISTLDQPEEIKRLANMSANDAKKPADEGEKVDPTPNP